MDNLRHTSPRPEIVVDEDNRAVSDVSTETVVGQPNPFGRERCVFALPLDPGGAFLLASTLVRDPGPALLADASNALVGLPVVWVPRMLTATWTEDTRRGGL